MLATFAECFDVSSDGVGGGGKRLTEGLLMDPVLNILCSGLEDFLDLIELEVRVFELLENADGADGE